MPPQRRTAKPAAKTARAPRATQNQRTNEGRDEEPPRAPRAARKTARGSQKTARVSAKPKPSVAVVGAGRVGTALAVALERRGYPVVALVSRTPAHARRSARLLASRPLALGANGLERLPATHILIIAVPDDQIARVSTDLHAAMSKAAAPALGARAREALAEGARRGVVVSLDGVARGVPRRRVALHVSGALPSQVLTPLRAHGYSTGSLHPLVSVADAATGADALRGAFFCVEGETKAVRAARQIVADLGGESFSVAAEDKALYHAAAVFAAGHAVALFDVATRLLARCGVERKLARRALVALNETALKNLAGARDNAGALTGPFARRDHATVEAHVAALAGRGLRAELRLYLELGRHATLMTSSRTWKGVGWVLDVIERAQRELDEGGRE